MISGAHTRETIRERIKAAHSSHSPFWGSGETHLMGKACLLNVRRQMTECWDGLQQLEKRHPDGRDVGGLGPEPCFRTHMEKK